MTKFCKFKLIFIVCLSVGLFLVFSFPALAQVTVSDPTVLDRSDFFRPGWWKDNGFGECFYLLPGPKVDGKEEEVGPVFFSKEPDQYKFNNCFGAEVDFLFPDNIDWRVGRGDPEEAALAFTAAPKPQDSIRFRARQRPGCFSDPDDLEDPAFLRENRSRGTTWDDGDSFTGVGIKPPIFTELAVEFEGSLSVAYYLVNGERPTFTFNGLTKQIEECRTQDFVLTVMSTSGTETKNVTLGEYSRGKYIVFELEGLSGETLIRFEAEPSASDECGALGIECLKDGSNFEICDYVRGENEVISGIFIDNCEPAPPCSIGDYVWEDANRDGCQDPDEDPIEGVEVKLFENCGNPTEIASTTTNAEGFYEFTGLDCDKEYRVQFGDAGDIYAYTEADQECSATDPPGPSDTKDSDCSQDDGFSGCVTFPDPVNNPNDPTIDCGYVCKGVIGDFVFLDEDVDGCQDNEPGIPMVDVTLSEDCDDPESSVIATTSTDENGKYMFTGLCPGDYFVEFGNDLPNTTPGDCRDNPGDPNDPTEDSNCGDRELQCVGLTRNNPEDPTIDCGKVPPCPLEVTKVAEPDDVMCESGTDGDSGTNGDPDPCLVPCEDTGTDGDFNDDIVCIAQTVTYTITVTNPSNRIVEDIMVDDEVLGFMEGPFTLGPGQSKKFTLPGECIKENTTNTVVVTVDGEICDTAMAEVTVDPVCIDTGTDGH